MRKLRWLIALILIVALVGCSRDKQSDTTEPKTEPFETTTPAMETTFTQIDPVPTEPDAAATPVHPKEILDRMNEEMANLLSSAYHIHTDVTAEISAEITSDDGSMTAEIPMAYSSEFLQNGEHAHFTSVNISSMTGMATKGGKTYPISHKEAETKEDVYFVLEEDGSISRVEQTRPRLWTMKTLPHGEHFHVPSDGSAAANAKAFFSDKNYTIYLNVKDLAADKALDGLFASYLLAVPNTGSGMRMFSDLTPAERDSFVVLTVDAETFRVNTVSLEQATFSTSDIKGLGIDGEGRAEMKASFLIQYDRWGDVSEEETQNWDAYNAAGTGTEYPASQPGQPTVTTETPEEVLERLPDSWTAGTFVMDGAKYTFPITWDEMDYYGWQPILGIYANRETLLKARSFSLAWAVPFHHKKYDGYQKHSRKYDFEIQAAYMNRATADRAITKCEIYAVKMDFEASDLLNSSVTADLILPGGITPESTKAEVLAAYGEPTLIDTQKDDSGRLFEFYQYGNAGKMQFINIIFSDWRDAIKEIQYVMLPDEGLVESPPWND